jgi:nickel/cobalt transporter (NicO) family protein
MTNEAFLLAGTAAAIGLGHTVLGPDHYLPFIVLSKARKWRGSRTTLITLFCGLGHVLSSVILAFAGVALGAAVFSIQSIESFRGSIAAWFMIIFGFTYFIWGIHHALRSVRHEHEHIHLGEEPHAHFHDHTEGHTHVHNGKPGSITPWVLFIVFILGPCEPLIPLVMYPAARHDTGAVILVVSVFGLTTVAVMLTMVLASYYGMSKISLPKLEKYSHSLAGLAILLCGGAVKLLGL